MPEVKLRSHLAGLNVGWLNRVIPIMEPATQSHLPEEEFRAEFVMSGSK